LEINVSKAKYLGESSVSNGFLLLKRRSGFNLRYTKVTTTKLGHSEEDDAIPHKTGAQKESGEAGG
jgi:hypothetical protein